MHTHTLIQRERESDTGNHSFKLTQVDENKVLSPMLLNDP